MTKFVPDRVSGALNLGGERSAALDNGLLAHRNLLESNDEGNRLRHLKHVADAVRRGARSKLYETAMQRRCDEFGCGVLVMTPPGQLVAPGLGNQSAAHLGLSLHHLFGVPVLPGSSLKGIAAHYSHEVFGSNNPDYAEKGNIYRLLFGDKDSRGFIRFKSAWATPESMLNEQRGLRLDVMTPEHTDYNTQKLYTGQHPRKGKPIAPEDTDNPVPIAFLSVDADFRVWLDCEDLTSQGQELTAIARQILFGALAERGIGGKTSSGYGRLLQTPDQS